MKKVLFILAMAFSSILLFSESLVGHYQRKIIKDESTTYVADFYFMEDGSFRFIENILDPDVYLTEPLMLVEYGEYSVEGEHLITVSKKYEHYVGEKLKLFIDYTNNGETDGKTVDYLIIVHTDTTMILKFTNFNDTLMYTYIRQ
jgi:hypothetical protein